MNVHVREFTIGVGGQVGLGLGLVLGKGHTLSDQLDQLKPDELKSRFFLVRVVGSPSLPLSS